MIDKTFLPVKALLSLKRIKFHNEYFQVFTNSKFELNDREQIASKFLKMSLTDVDIHKLIKLLNEVNINPQLWRTIVNNLFRLTLTSHQIDEFIQILKNEEISWRSRDNLVLCNLIF